MPVSLWAQGAYPNRPVELIVPHLGLTKLSYGDFTPIAQLNGDPAAVTVKADAP